MTTKLAFNQIDGSIPTITDDGAVGDGVTNNGTIIDSAVNIPIGEFVYNESQLTTNGIDVSGIGQLINNTVDEHVLALGEKQSGANVKYEYAKVSDIQLSDNSTHTDDNWATVNSSVDYTTYQNIVVKDSYVGS